MPVLYGMPKPKRKIVRMEVKRATGRSLGIPRPYSSAKYRALGNVRNPNTTHFIFVPHSSALAVQRYLHRKTLGRDVVCDNTFRYFTCISVTNLTFKELNAVHSHAKFNVIHVIAGHL